MNDFHFLIDAPLADKLNNVAREHDMSFSCLVNLLLDIGLSRFEKRYFCTGDMKSKWKRVGETVVRKHVFVDRSTYRRLKHVHVVCNVYSMGQILRRIAGVVLFLVVRWGWVKALRFFEKGNKKYQKPRYKIGEKREPKHMHTKIGCISKFSEELIPISVEFP